MFSPLGAVPYVQYADWLELAAAVVTVLALANAYDVRQETVIELTYARTELEYIIAKSARLRTTFMLIVQLLLFVPCAVGLFIPPPGAGMVFGVQASMMRIFIMLASAAGWLKSQSERKLRRDVWTHLDRRREQVGHYPERRRQQRHEH